MDTQRKSSSCFIIATKDRPDDLLRTVESLLAQSVLPAEVCIVDAGERAPLRARIEAMCERAGIRLRYLHPAPTGLPRQRNLGIDRTVGDPVFFVDDDVLLDPACHEEILREYERRGPELGGVCAATPRRDRTSRISRLYHRFFDVTFGLGGWWPDAPAKVTRGFFVRGPTDAGGPVTLPCFKGHFMSFRRQIFDHERFDEALSGYAWKEDFDLTYRVSRRFTLVMLPTARCEHLQSPSGRSSGQELERMKLANQFYLHRKLQPQTLSYRASLWRAVTGLFLYDIVVAVKRRDAGIVRGLLQGVSDQVRGSRSPAGAGIG